MRFASPRSTGLLNSSSGPRLTASTRLRTKDRNETLTGVKVTEGSEQEGILIWVPSLTLDSFAIAVSWGRGGGCSAKNFSQISLEQEWETSFWSNTTGNEKVRGPKYHLCFLAEKYAQGSALHSSKATGIFFFFLASIEPPQLPIYSPVLCKEFKKH